ncbi:MAG TPA: hypothetical protein VKO43_08990 [Candidatus Krumholzibacteriaceae bacterium]|nr:hypothetical protein [Candidatus Krumholzibacteriaceae bacterium]
MHDNINIKKRILHLVRFEFKLLLKYSQAAIIIPVFVLFSLLMMKMGGGKDFFTMIIIITAFILGVIFNRQFSIADNEFILYQMMPVSFENVITAKNISLFIFAVIQVALVVSLNAFVYGLERVFVIDSLLLGLFLSVLFLSTGNILSLRALKRGSSHLSLLDNIIMAAVLLAALPIYAVMTRMFSVYIAVPVYLVLGGGYYMLIFSKTRKMFCRDRKGILERLCMQ